MIKPYKKHYAGRIIILTTLFSLLYAIVRYNIYGGVPWKDLPLFILNKGISLASLILLTINFSLSPLNNLGIKVSDKWLDARKLIGITGFLFAFIHVFMSFSILNPSYYPVFFIADGTLSVRGGLSLLGGIVSFIFLWVYNISFKPTIKEDKKLIAMITSRKFLIYAMIFTGIHLLFMGYSGWLTPNKWQMSLVPISLISFVIFFIGFLINLIGRK
ncbi:MAG: hypothetical protein L3J34_02025 [Flavobacteriaceae bacterium]|nr:hypothetical protein [Flavobacteriaceae bacterium]